MELRACGAVAFSICNSRLNQNPFCFSPRTISVTENCPLPSFDPKVGVSMKGGASTFAHTLHPFGPSPKFVTGPGPSGCVFPVLNTAIVASQWEVANINR